jgi:hypothetical protein
MKANAPHSLFDVSSFDCYSDNYFPIGASSTFAGLLAANEKFIHFNTPG